MKFDPDRIRKLIPETAVKTDTGCWNWPTRFTQGYGSIRIDGKTKKAHRISWMVFKGRIPYGKSVCHHCDNPPCVNPEHLFLGTHKENMQDMSRKGRAGKPHSFHPRPKGSMNGMVKNPGCLAGHKNGRAKLNEDQRLELYLRRKSGERRIDLSREFQIGELAIYRMCRSFLKQITKKQIQTLALMGAEMSK